MNTYIAARAQGQASGSVWRATNLPIYQGDDFVAIVTVQDAAGELADLTGYTARAQIRRGPADRYEEIFVEIATMIAGSEISLGIPHEETEILTAGQYVWDLQLTAADGTITTILAGRVTVRLEVTRLEEESL